MIGLGNLTGSHGGLPAAHFGEGFRMTEHMWFWLSSFPPLFILLVLIYMFSGDPVPLLKVMVSMIPGLEFSNHDEDTKTVQLSYAWPGAKKRSESAEQLGDCGQLGQAMPADSIPSNGKDLGENEVSDDERGGILHSQVREMTQSLDFSQQVSKDFEKMQKGLRVHLSHFGVLLAFPFFFVCFYMWNAAFVQKFASRDFPLSHCEEDFHCFYIRAKYNMFKFPAYEDIECDVLRQKTAESSTGFLFNTPEGATFFKCYACVFSIRHFVGTIGDATALSVLVFLVVLWCLVSVDPDSSAKVRHHLEKRVQWLRCKQALMAVCMVCSLLFNAHVYGRYLHAVEGIVLFPCVMAFGFLLVNVQRHTAEKYLVELAEKENAEGQRDNSRDLQSVDGSSSDDDNSVRRRCGC